MADSQATVLEALASSQGRDDESPNIELAQAIAAAHESQAIDVLIVALGDARQAIRSDALKVLYEVGKIDPQLLTGRGQVFVDLLESRNNRMIWGGMEALAAVAQIEPLTLVPHVGTIMHATETGSVITRDWGVRVLTTIAIADAGARRAIEPFLLEILATCQRSEFPRHAESMQPLLNSNLRLSATFRELAGERLPALTAPQSRRVMRVLTGIG